MVAVKVTFWPRSDGLELEETAVLVGALSLVRLNEAGVAPTLVAVTLYGPPAIALAIAGVLAWPLSLITVLKTVTPPLRLALGPLAGAVNVIAPPATGSLPTPVTVASKGAGKVSVIEALAACR
jgi:hypothetical protein